MHLTHFRTGTHTTQESRLLSMSLELGTNPLGPPQGADAFVDTIQNAASWMADTVLPGNREARIKNGTERRLNDPQQWVTAFQRTDILGATVPQRPLTGDAYGPQELLESKTVRERQMIFLRFVRASTPPAFMASEPVFNIRGLREASLENFAAANPAGDLMTAAEIARIPRILTLVGAAVGSKALQPATPATPEDTQNTDIVRQMLNTHYPLNDPENRHLLDDYIRAIKILRGPGLPPPSNAQMRTREELLKLITSTQNSGKLPVDFPRRFLAWLQHEDPVRVQNILSQFDPIREREDKTKLEALQIPQKRQAELKEKIAASIPERVMEVYNRLEPWQQYTAIGLGIFAGWKILRGEGFVASTARTALVGVAGLSAFEYLVLGTPPSRGLMARGLESLQTNLGGNVPEKNRKMLQMMARYTNERAFMHSAEIADSLALMATLKMSDISNALTINVTGGQLRYELSDTMLRAKLEDQRKDMGLKKEAVDKIFKGPHKEAIAQAVGNIFYRMGGRNPNNRDKVEYVEKARRNAITVYRVPDANTGESRPFSTSRSYANITDTTALGYYMEIADEGRQIVLNQHAGNSFSDMVGALMTQATLERPDEAQLLSPPGTGTNNTRQKERAVYSLSSETVSRNLDVPRQRLVNEFGEFLDFWKADGRRVLNITDADKKTYIARATMLIAPPPPGTQPSLTEGAQILDRLRFTILRAATFTGTLTGTEVTDLFSSIEGPGGTPRNPAQLLTAMGQWLNAKLNIFGNNQEIRGIDSVIALIQGRLGRRVDVDGNGEPLVKQLQRHKDTFASLRRAEAMADRALGSLRPEDLNRLGNAKIAREFLVRVFNRKAYRDVVDDNERTYAHRVAIDLFTAQLTQHKADGEHSLSPLDNQFVSATEQQNLIQNNEWLLQQITGPMTQPLRGMWTFLAINGQLHTMFAQQLNATSRKDETKRREAIEGARQLAALSLCIFPPNEENRKVLAAALSEIGEHFRQENEEQDKVSDDAGRMLRRNVSYKDDLRDLVLAMKLLGLPPTETTPLEQIVGRANKDDVEAKAKAAKLKEDADKKKKEEEAKKKAGA